MKFRFSFFFVALLLILSWNLSAQTSEKLQSGSFSVTVNPSFFILGGYSVKAFYHLPKKWSFGLSAEAGFDLPNFARDQFFMNNGNIDVHWDFLVGVEARYRFNNSDVDKGFYALATLGFEGWSIEDQNGNMDEFDNWYSSLGLGYNWYPFKRPNFHLGVSYNVVFILNNTDERTVGQEIYNINQIVPPSFAPVIYLGWRF